MSVTAKRLDFRCLVYLLLLVNSYAEEFQNNWIIEDQVYFKLGIVQKGIYRLDYNYLLSRGFPVLRADPKFFQLWRRGKEVSIYISGAADGVFNEGDYIDFVAQGNDGRMEGGVYIKPEAQTHPQYSLYSDTAAYFLTIGNYPGKRMPIKSSAFVQPSEYHWQIDEITKAVNYSAARDPNGFGGSEEPKTSFALEGEGWVGNDFGSGNQENTVISVSGFYNQGPQTSVQLNVVGRSPRLHYLQVACAASNGNTAIIPPVEYIRYEKRSLSYYFSNTDFLTNAATLTVSCKDMYGASALSSISLYYPQLTNRMLQLPKIFHVLSSMGDHILVPALGTTVAVYAYSDLHNAWIPAIQNAGTSSRISISSTDSAQHIVLSNTFLKPEKFEKITFRKLPERPNYILLTHKTLAQSGVVREYATYRASAQGGNFDTLVLYMDEVYNRFSYGETNYLAIRNLCRWLYSNLRGNPVYLFLLGQGITVNYVYKDTWARLNPAILNDITNPFYNFVPAFGYPPSDIAYAQGIGSELYENPVYIGRFAARNANEIRNYLNKVKDHESLPEDLLWRKNILFLSGGKTNDQIITYKAFIEELARKAAGTYLGANTLLFSKSTPLNTQYINVSKEVNAGLSMIYSIGHTSQTYFDVNIGFASDPAFNYSNKLKYPFLYVNGCSSGNIFFSNSLGQDWLTTPNKGAIAFLAHSDVGADQIMHNYAQMFFDVAYGDSAFLGKPIARIQSEANRRYMLGKAATGYHVAQTQQFILQSDPAIKLYNPSYTDYSVSDASISVSGKNSAALTSRTDSIVIRFRVINYGLYTTQPLKVQVSRTLPNGEIIKYKPFVFEGVPRDTLLECVVANTDKSMKIPGLNTFELCLNFDRSIRESNYNNNCGLRVIKLQMAEIRCLFPTQYGIVSDTLVNFVAQSANLTEPIREYVFELDTHYLFQSNIKNQQTIRAGALVNTTINLAKLLPLGDSVVFFWRIRFKTSNKNEENVWAKSSFIYIKNSSEGWSQALFPQFSESKLRNVGADTLARKWTFLQKQVKIGVTTHGAQVPNGCYDTQIQFDESAIYQPNMCGLNFRFGCNGFIAIPIDQYTLAPYTNYNLINPNNNLICKNGHTLLAAYTNPSNFNIGAFVQIVKEMADGDYLLLVNSGNALVTHWSQAWKDSLKAFGASKLFSQNDQAPFIFLGQKKGKALAEVLADTTLTVPAAQQSLRWVYTLKTSGSAGAIKSSIIGPASEWGTLGRKFIRDTSRTFDIWKLKVYGMTFSATEDLLLEQETPAYLDLKSLVDAKKYPQLRLEAFVSDSALKTPPQLKKWQVNYTGVPEGTLVLQAANGLKITQPPGVLKEGETFTLSFAFQNISARYFPDSIPVVISIINTTQNKTFVYNKRIKSPLPGATTPFFQEIDTKTLAGLNSVQVFVNPRVVPELYYDNNYFEMEPFEVITDKINPLLDVTFDDRYIENLDIVSPNVVIKVSVRDESRIKFLQDTSVVNLSIKKPCGENPPCLFERIPLQGPYTYITPGTLQNYNTFTVSHRAEEWPDGVYTFRATATDASGNMSATLPYQIQFRIISQQAVTNFLPYPNPFSTQCFFAFTLTGSTLPDVIKIEIYDVAGKLVKVLTQADLSPVRIGENVANIVWDGTDHKGNRLASGMYYFTSVVLTNGTRPAHLRSGADAYIRNGFGKLLLIR